MAKEKIDILITGAKGRLGTDLLDNSKYKKEVTGSFLRPWQDALKEYIQCQKYLSADRKN